MIFKILSASFQIPKAIFDAAAALLLRGEGFDDNFEEMTESEFRVWASNQEGVSSDDIDRATEILGDHFKDS